MKALTTPLTTYMENLKEEVDSEDKRHSCQQPWATEKKTPSPPPRPEGEVQEVEKQPLGAGPQSCHGEVNRSLDLLGKVP